MKNLIQKRKVGIAGSFINQMMGNNNTRPKVGEYCTFLHYTDRTVGIVRSFDPEKNIVTIEDCTTIADNRFRNDIGHQNWVHTPNGNLSSYIYKKNGWNKIHNTIIFTNEFLSTIPHDHFVGEWLRNNNPKLLNEIYNDNPFPSVIIDGITKTKKEYVKISIIFGACDYYYDWSF